MDVLEQLPLRKLPQQERSRALVGAILDGAERSLAKVGYDRATTNRIAEAAGVSIGSLYQYFQDKEAIVLSVAMRHGQQQVDALREEIDTLLSAPLEQAVGRLVGAILRAHEGDPALHQALLQGTLSIGLERLRPMQDRARAVVRAWLELRRDQVAVADVDAAAFVLVATVEGVIHAALFEQPERLRDAAFRAELVQLVLRYLRPSPPGQAGEG